MKVTVAGATMDRRFWKEDNAATPETISAAYARISHSPKRIHELRDIAVNEVEKARRSNERIIYSMGHSSVAEHAVFNIDIEDASRLLVEFIEGHRIASFTERSQRYVFFGDKSFVIPPELEGTPLERKVRELEREKFDLYNEVVSNSELKERYGDRLLEQARYILGLTCPTDLGLTINARETEYIIAQGSAHPLKEVRDLAGQLLEATGELAPSLIKYTKGNFHVHEARNEINRVLKELVDAKTDGYGREVTVLDPGIKDDCPGISETTPYRESEVIATLVMENSDMSLDDARCLVGTMTRSQLIGILLPVFGNYPVHAPLPRAFEMMDLTFEFMISASGFAQLKRHRMATLLSQRYDPALWEIPEVYGSNAKILRRYNDLMVRSGKLYGEIAAEHGYVVAQYILTNAHKRRVVFRLNLRELYHFARLRSDNHAQDEIRRISDMMVRNMRERYPLVTLMLCGKDGFEGVKEELPGK